MKYRERIAYLPTRIWVHGEKNMEKRSSEGDLFPGAVSP